MPRDGSMILSDVRSPTFGIVCEACGRRGRYNVERLVAELGDAKLTDLLATLASCEKAARSAPTTDARRCTSGSMCNLYSFTKGQAAIRD